MNKSEQMHPLQREIMDVAAKAFAAGSCQHAALINCILLHALAAQLVQCVRARSVRMRACLRACARAEGRLQEQVARQPSFECSYRGQGPRTVTYGVKLNLSRRRAHFSRSPVHPDPSTSEFTL